MAATAAVSAMLAGAATFGFMTSDLSASISPLGNRAAVDDSTDVGPEVDMPSTGPVDLSGVAAWAEAEGLHGLSPASVQAVPATSAVSRGPVDLSGVAAWAEAEGLHGLSPASLHTSSATPAVSISLVD